MNRPDLFKSLDADLEEFLAFLAEAKQAWELEDMVRDLIPPFVGGGPADDEIIDAVVAKLSASPAGVSALHVMGLVAMPLVALRARGAVERIVEAGGPAPSSLARRCGGLKPVQAWCLTGKDEADSYLFLCHRPRVTRAQVGLVASGDFGDGPILIEGSLSAPVPESDVRSLIDDF